MHQLYLITAVTPPTRYCVLSQRLEHMIRTGCSVDGGDIDYPIGLRFCFEGKDRAGMGSKFADCYDKFVPELV